MSTTVEEERLRFEGDFDKWNQPEAYALMQRLANSLAVFTKHYDKRWMDRWGDDYQSSTFSLHTFGQLREALRVLEEADTFVTRSSSRTMSHEISEVDKWIIKWADADADVTRLKAILADAERVMAPNIYPKPDVGPEHPYSVLQRIRAALSPDTTPQHDQEDGR